MPRSVALPVLAVLLAVPLASPAVAHTSLAGSLPAAGSSAAAPTEVVLSFTGEVLPDFTAVSVRGPGGADAARGEARVEGDAVVQPLDARLAPGTWTVAYRVVSQDGHPVTGSLTFTVSPGPAATPGAPTAVPPSVPPVASAPLPTSVPVSRSAPAGPDARVLLAALALATGAAVLLLRRRRRARG